jgi:MFS family permease
MRYCEDFTLFMGIRFVEGAAHVTAVSMWMALAADRADGKRSGAVMGIMAMVLMLGTTIGVPLGGIVGRNDPLITFQLGAIFVAAAALVAILFLNEPDERTDSPSVRQSLNSVRSRPILLVPFAYAFIDRFCVGGIISTLTLYMANVLELSRPMIGGLLSLALFPFALLCYPAGRLADRIGRTKPLVFGSLGYGFIFASFGFLDRNGLGIALLISGVLSAVMFAPNLALCRDLAPKNLRTTVFAGFNAAGSLGMLLGPLAGGLICILLGPESQGFTESDSQGYLEQEARSYRTALVLIGMTQLLCVICTLPFLRRVSRASLDEPTTGVRTARGHAI